MALFLGSSSTKAFSFCILLFKVDILHNVLYSQEIAYLRPWMIIRKVYFILWNVFEFSGVKWLSSLGWQPTRKIQIRKMQLWWAERVGTAFQRSSNLWQTESTLSCPTRTCNFADMISLYKYFTIEFDLLKKNQTLFQGFGQWSNSLQEFRWSLWETWQITIERSSGGRLGDWRKFCISGHHFFF